MMPRSGKDQHFLPLGGYFLLLKNTFLRFYLFIFRERGREGERGEVKHQCVVASWAPPIGDLACNPGMCPDWESNWQHVGSQARAQSTEPHQPGLGGYFNKFFLFSEIKSPVSSDGCKGSVINRLVFLIASGKSKRALSLRTKWRWSSIFIINGIFFNLLIN